MRIRNNTKVYSRKSLRESQIQATKSFDEVVEGDIGRDYDGNEVIILAKGPATNFSDADGFEEFVDLSDYDPEDIDFNDQIDAEWPECVLVQFKDGSEVVYTYGSDGVTVPRDDRVHSFSFDFTIQPRAGLSVGEAEQRIINEIELIEGITVVGNPGLGDTSWTKEEYGLSESTKRRSKRSSNLRTNRFC